MRRLALLAVMTLCGCPQSIDILQERDGGTAVTDGGARDAGSRDAGSGGARCGDDRKDPGELCDGPDLGGADCASEGIGIGALSCNARCDGYDTAACVSCTSDCVDRMCGADPVCGISCGTCGTGEACNLVGACVASCEPGSYTCSGDGFGWFGCGFDPTTGVADVGPRIACATDAACDLDDGTPCVNAECQSADIVFVVDRSASMATGATWTWVTETLVDVLARYEHGNRLGAREFPGASTCVAGALVTPAIANRTTVAMSLTAPGQEASSPILNSVQGLDGAVFTGRHDAQAIVLLTDGTETCAEQELTQREISRLFRLGVRTFPIGLTTRADGAFLDGLAAVGGTDVARSASDAGSLRVALEEVLTAIGACENPRATVTAGYYHACGLRADGTLACWGRDLDGQSSPPPGSFVAVDASTDAVCAIRKTGALVCWGRDINGEIDPPTGAFSALAGGDSHFCGVRNDGTLACWGNDTAGQSTPPAGTFVDVATSGFASCALRSDGTAECWGSPRPPTPPGVYTQIVGGRGFCGLRTDGEIDCVGGGGLGSPPAGPFVGLDAGQNHACAVRANGDIACWGNNGSGESTPPGGERFVDVSVNNAFTCAATADDAFLCWGEGGNGQTSPP